MNIRKIKPAAWYWLSVILLVLVGSALAYSVYVPKLQELEDVKRQISLAKQQQAGLLNIQVPQKIAATDKAALAALVPVDFDQSRFLETIRQEESDSGASIASIVFTDGMQATATKPNQPPQSGGPGGPKPSVLTEQHGTLRVVGQYGQVRQFIEAFSKMSRLVSFRGWNLTLDLQESKPVEPVTPPTDASLESAVSDPVTKDPLLHDKTQIPSKQNSDKVTNQTTDKTGTLRTQQTPDPAHLEIQQTPTMPANPAMPATPLLPASTPPASDDGTDVTVAKFTLEINFTIYDVPTAKDLLPALAPDPSK